MKNLLTEEALRMQRLAGLIKEEEEDFSDWDDAVNDSNIVSPYDPEVEQQLEKHIVGGFKRAGIKTGPSDVVGLLGVMDDENPGERTLGEMSAQKFLEDIINGYIYHSGDSAEDLYNDMLEGGLVIADGNGVSSEMVPFIPDGYSQRDHKAGVFLLDEKGMHLIEIFQK